VARNAYKFTILAASLSAWLR